MPEKFWMVWVHGTPTTERRHTSALEARREADRVARQNVGKKVYVLEALDYRWVEDPLITHEVLSPRFPPPSEYLQ